MRVQLAGEVNKLIDTLGPELYDDFEEVRIIDLELNLYLTALSLVFFPGPPQHNPQVMEPAPCGPGWGPQRVKRRVFISDDIIFLCCPIFSWVSKFVLSTSWIT